MEEFNEVTKELGLMETVESNCYQHTNDSDDIMDDSNCSLVYNVCRDLILRTGLTTSACLNGTPHDDDHDDGVSHAEGELILITIMTTSQGCVSVQLMDMDFYQPQSSA